MTDEKQYVPIVLDCGSFETKAGLSGGFFEPSSVVRTMVTKIKRKNREEEIEVGSIPDQNIENYSSIDIIISIQRGIITNWKELELIWSHIFYSELKIDPTKHPILLSEPVLNPKHNRQRLVQLLFDTFEVSAVSVVLEPLLVLYLYKAPIGLSVSSGHEVTQLLPIYEGLGIIHAIRRIKIGGNTINNILKQKIQSLHPNIEEIELDNIIENIKITHCVVPQSLQTFHEAPIEEIEYKIDNQRTILLSSTTYLVAEVLFSPYLFDLDLLGIHEVVSDLVQSLAIDIKNDILLNIFLSGGNTMLRGFSDRLKAELEILNPNSRIYCGAHDYRKHAAFIGGAVLATISDFDQYWFKKESFLSEGVKAIHDFCT